MPAAVPFQPPSAAFRGPFFGGPGGFQNLVLPCTMLTTVGLIAFAVPRGVEWYGTYYDQLMAGGFADAAPAGLITASIANLLPKPVYIGGVQANSQIAKGDYIQLCYDGSLGAAGGFHLLDWDNKTGASVGGNFVVVTAAGLVTVGAQDGTIAIDKVAHSATPIQLPSVASRNGLALHIVDWTGSNGDVTITPAGAEKIMGLASATLGSGVQGLGSAAAITLYPSVTLNGWYA